MPRKLTIALGLAVLTALTVAPAALAAADLNQVIENMRVWITGLLAGRATPTAAQVGLLGTAVLDMVEDLLAH